jgi:lysophospholipase L1-like esterase
MINLRALAFILMQLLLAGWVIAMGVWTKISWPGAVGLVLGTLAPLLIKATEVRLRKRSSAWGLGAAWSGALLVWGTLLRTTGPWDSYYAVMAWLAAGLTFLAGVREPAAKVRWRRLAMSWAIWGDAIWLVEAYVTNRRAEFLAGLLLSLCLLILCRVWFSPGTIGVQAVNTLMLLLIGLPLADLVARHPAADATDPRQKYYTYEKGRRDPASFDAWMEAIQAEYDRMRGVIFAPDLRGILPHRLRPDSRTTFLQIPVRINRRGFRGPEIPDHKGATYRIVTLGESTTFGYGFTPEDRLWPAALEQLIRERLKPARAVEVINAGVPALDLKNNLARLTEEILPLQPDLIISYHGLNGFHLLSEALPHTSASNPPRFKPRPLRLLAEAEYGLKVRRFKHRYMLKLERDPPRLADPMTTEYASAYRQLIAFALANHIQLVLANYSMAVNATSDSKVVDFYRRMAPETEWLVKANAIHSFILRQLAAEHPEVRLVDTHPNLDGEHDKFIDLVHFTPDGEAQMAEAMFAGIRKVLEADLTK